VGLGQRIADRRGDALALGAVGAVLLLLFSSVISGDRSLLAFPDNSHQTYAWFSFAARDGALWDPYQFGGHSFVAELQTAFFYPLSWLLFQLTGAGITGRGITGFLIAHVLLAAAFQYAFVRTLGATRAGAVVAALVWAASGYMLHRLVAQANIFTAAVWLPLIFLLFHLALQRALWIAVPAGAAVGVGILAGHIQPPAFALLGIGAYGLWHVAVGGPRRRRAAGRAAAALAITAAVAGAVAAVQLVPSLEYRDRAVRFISQPEPARGSEKLPYDVVGHLFVLEPGQLDGFLSPQFAPDVQDGRLYAGVVTLFLVAIGLWRGPRRHTVFWALLALLALLYAMGYRAGVHRVAYELIPLIDTIREPARGLILTSFGLSVLAGFGASALTETATLLRARRGPLPARAALAGIGAAAALALLVWALDGDPVAGNGEAAWIAVALAVLTLAIVLARGIGWLGPAAAGALCVVALTLDLVQTGQPLFARTADYDGRSNLEPHRYYRETGSIRFLESQPGPFRVSNPFEVVPQNSGDVHGIEMLQGHAASMTIDLFDLLATGGAPPSRAHDLLNVRYAITNQPPQGWRRVYTEGETGVFENPGALPRAFLTARWEVQPDPPAAMRRATDPGFPYRDAAVLDSQPREAEPGRGAPGEARLVRRDPTELVFESRARAPAILVASELWYPGWRAEVDGGERRIMRADGVLRAVEVPAGTHRVTMTYRPTHWGAAVAASAAGVLLLAGVSLAALVRRRRRAP
jgi:hypothetical protein